MRLKTKLVIATTVLTFAIVITVSVLFIGELLRQRVTQTAESNDVLAHEVLLATQHAIENGIRVNPPQRPGADAFQAAVLDALRSDTSLTNTMDAIVRYSPTVQDVYVTGTEHAVIVSTDPTLVSASAPYRTLFASIHEGSLLQLSRAVFGHPTVLDVALPLDRNGEPFLVVHMGIRSTFLRASYAPWLKPALAFSALAVIGCIFASAFLSSLALRPLERITARLEQLSHASSAADKQQVPDIRQQDTVGRASASIDLLGRQLETSAAQHSALSTNLNQILHTLKDGVMLFTGDGRAVTVSDASFNFLDHDRSGVLGRNVNEIFDRNDALGRLICKAFEDRHPLNEEPVTLSNGRQVEVSLDFIQSPGDGDSQLGALLTLHDVESEIALEQEIELSRRLGAIGRLTAGVGHEVKNPINAMVVHLELLRNKLENTGNQNGARKHVDILSNEMQRLDRVVQTLADFSRPLDLHLKDHDIRAVVSAVLDLTSANAEQNDIHIERRLPPAPLLVRVDSELVRQALLNIVLNAMQAMHSGGKIEVTVGHDHHNALVSVTDQGVGIPPELRSRIFDLYFTTKPRGSGIGLAMTYRILQMHGGSIDLISETSEDSPARGTTFTLRLPLASRQSPAYAWEARA